MNIVIFKKHVSLYDNSVIYKPTFAYKSKLTLWAKRTIINNIIRSGNIAENMAIKWG